MSQWIVIDDFDSAITYNTADPASPWNAVNESVPGTVDLDNAIFQTGHVLLSNGSLSFSFTGTDVEVFGVSSKLNSQTENISGFSWTCSVDGIPIPSNHSALDGFPWTSYCGQTGMINVPHVLHVNVSVNELSQFWLDYIRYAPFPGSVPENQTILVESLDPAIQYSTGWQPSETVQVAAGTEPVNMTFTFNGTGIIWYTLTLQGNMKATNTSTGTFIVDGETTALITMDYLPQDIVVNNGNNRSSSYDMPLFEYHGLDPTKEHVLTATYQGNIDVPPLTLDFLLVQVGPGLAAGVNSSGASPGALPTQSTSPTPPVAQTPSKGSHRVRPGTITGAALGSLLFFFAILVGVRYWHRRQRTSTERALSALTDGAAGVEYRVSESPQGPRHEDSRW